MGAVRARTALLPSFVLLASVIGSCRAQEDGGGGGEVDCATPENGPNGAGCANGNCRDGTPSDGAFTCRCTPPWSGPNCDICGSGVFQQTQCSGSGSTLQQFSDAQCTVAVGSEVTDDALWLMSPHAGTTLGADQCHHNRQVTASFTISCVDGSPVQPQWRGSECLDADLAFDMGSPGDCTCIPSPRMEVELQPCDSGNYTKTACNADGGGSTKTMYSDNQCRSPIAGTEQVDALAWLGNSGPGGAMGLENCHVMPRGSDPPLGYTLTCTGGEQPAGLMTVYANTNCTGDVMFVRHDDDCECADEMTQEQQAARQGGDCADPANGPNGRGCATGQGQCNDGAYGDGAFTCDCRRQHGGANCDDCTSGFYQQTVCQEGGGSSYTQYTDPECANPTGHVATDPLLWLHDSLGGYELGAENCHHPPGGGMSYTVVCDADLASAQTMWQGPQCMSAAAARGHGDPSACTCAPPQMLETEVAECPSGLYSKTLCADSGLGSVKSFYSDGTCDTPADTPASQTSTFWLGEGIPNGPLAIGPSHCHPVQQGWRTLYMVLSCHADGIGLQSMFNDPSCSGDTVYMKHDDGCMCVAPPPPPVAVTDAGAVSATLVLEGDIAEILAADGGYGSFSAAFAIDVSGALSVAPDRVIVDRISAGSVVVEFHVLADADGAPVASAAMTSALTAGITVASRSVSETVSGVMDPVPPPAPEPAPEPEPEPAPPPPPPPPPAASSAMPTAAAAAGMLLAAVATSV